MRRILKRILNDTAGSSAIEYAIIATVISVAALGAYAALGQQSNENMTKVASSYAAVQ